MANPQKEVREVIKEAERQGWRAVEKKKGIAVYDPSGRFMEMLHKTPSDHRGLKNSIGRMRRYGFTWKGH